MKKGLQVIVAITFTIGLLLNASSVMAQGPDFQVSFDPGNGQNVGSSVNIHVRVNSSNPGATRIFVPCGGVSKGETSEVEFDSNWNTGGCSAGNQQITVQSRDPNVDWSGANTQVFNYELTSNQPPPQPNPPSITCWIDSFNVSPNPATVGDQVQINGHGSCNNVEVRATRVFFGGDVYEIGGNNTLSKTWNTSNVSPGSYKIKLEVAGLGDNNWSQAASQTIDLQINDQGQSQPSQSTNCQITSVDVYPNSPQAPGVKVKINAAGRCDSNVRAWRVKVDGDVQYEFGASPTFTWTWDTGGWNDGNHKVRIELASIGDDNWSNIDADVFTYALSSSASPPDDPNKAFGNCEAINIGYPAYVIVKEGSAIQRRQVPNETTLDALGFSRQMINNKGFSDQALLTIGEGVNIPDVARDPDGFRTFKATFCPSLSPIVPGQNSGTINTPTGQQYFDPHAPGVCEGQVTRLWPGAEGRVTNQGDGLKLRTEPKIQKKNAKEAMSSGYRFYVVGGPTCSDGYTWWQITGPKGTGWSAEKNGEGVWWMAPIEEAPEVQPTQIPQVKPNTEQANLLSDSACDELSKGQWWNPFNPPEVGATEQCTAYVARTNSEIEKCWNGARPDGGLWDDWANDPDKSGECGWSVSNNFSTAHQGDVVTWDPSYQNGGKSCEGANSEAGHVATFQGLNDDGTIRVTESNWIRDHDKVKVNPDCMNVIHMPAVTETPSEPASPSPNITIASNCNQYWWPWSWFCKNGWIK